MVGPSVADVLKLRCPMENRVTEDVVVEVEVEAEGPSIPVIPAMNVENQVTMPGTVVEEVGGDAHHHHIGHAEDHTLEAGLAQPQGVDQDMDLRKGEVQSMTPAHDPEIGQFLENVQSLGHQHPDVIALDLRHPEGAAPAQQHPMAVTDHLTVLD